MRNSTKFGLAFLFLTAAAGTCFSQSNTELPKYFHLDFAVKELEGGKVTNTRAYATTISTGDSGCTIRTGSKVPVPTAGAGSSFTYIDVGVNIDCRSAKEIGDQLALNVTADISGPVNELPSPGPPVIRQTKWSSNVLVALRKPTTIFSSDDPTTSKRQTQLELTATPIR